MRVTFLGTGAPLHPTRNTMGLLVEAAGCTPLLIDSCGGFELMRTLAKAGFKDEQLAELGNIVLTHRHGDHIGGVMALFLALPNVRLYGPEDALEAATKMLETTYPHFSPIRGHHVTSTTVRPGKAYHIGGFELSFFAVEHRVPTYAVRVGLGEKALAFSADSLPCDALVACARDADLFICDALCAATDASTDAVHALMHPVAGEAADLAERAGAKALALTHLARYATPAKMLEQARSSFSGAITIPEDGDTVEM